MRLLLLLPATVMIMGQGTLLSADVKLKFTAPTVLSQEVAQVPGGADPGGAASKGKLVLLTKTPGGALDGRLVTVYADSNYANGQVWHPKTKQHLARDVFARYSDDQGATWSDPVNLSQTAELYSAMTDWDGNGIETFYWGDSAKPTIFNHGQNVVVSWVDKYAPEATWAFGDVGESQIQGKALYTDPAVLTKQREIPFSALYLAVSNDGGATWIYGGANPPMQVTFGLRDAIQDTHRGIGNRWTLTWQEDPLGLQTGEGEGPGTGASGARVSKGTDIWYSFTSDLVKDPLALCTNRTPLSDHSTYDVDGAGGFPLIGNPGSLSNHGSSRCNTRLVKDGAAFYAVMAYEETKGLPDLEEGKTVQYHTFVFDAPPIFGPSDGRFGDAGVTLSPLAENSRRVRLFTQGVTGVDPAIVIYWRQGLEAKGAPADVMLKVSTALGPASLLAAPTLNMTSNLPSATAANFTDDTWDIPLENALAHRGFMRGSTIVFGCSYTANGPVARYTNLANFNFYIRRSFDGGLTWLPAQNISRIKNTKINVKEPRIITTPNTGTQNLDVFLVAWGTETNVFEGVEESQPLDIYVRRSTTSGDTYERTTRLGTSVTGESESQLRLNPPGDEVYAVWMESGSAVDAIYAMGVPVKVSSGSGGCAANPDAAVDPLLLALLAGGVVILTLRTRRSRSRGSSG